jgi:hypothetical protein
MLFRLSQRGGLSVITYLYIILDNDRCQIGWEDNLEIRGLARDQRNLIKKYNIMVRDESVCMVETLVSNPEH